MAKADIALTTLDPWPHWTRVVKVVTPIGKPHPPSSISASHMSETQKSADMESLARMAARLAGRNPDEQVTIQLGDMPAFDDVLWKYPDFLARAEAA